MLFIVVSGISGAGLALLARKLSASFGHVLRLSDDLNPNPRTASVRSGSESPVHGNASIGGGLESCAESMLRLSGAIAGARGTSSDSIPAPVEKEVPVS